jgi:hypothetical protein
MAVFNLTFRTLGGQTYRIPVKSTLTIHDVKMKVLNKLKSDKNYPQNKALIENAEIRLSYTTNNNSYEELMDNQLVSDYPALSENPLIGVSIHTPLFKVHVVDTENGYEMDIYIKPTDTIFDVKKKIYMKLLEIPFYATCGSSMVSIKYKNRYLLQPSLTVSKYPAIESSRMIEIFVDEQQFYTEVRKEVSRNRVDIIQDDIPFSFLMKGSELKKLLTSSKINETKEFELHINNARGVKIEDDAYLFEYPTFEYDSYLYLVYASEKNDNNSNNSDNVNNNRSNYSYHNNYYGGRSMTKRKSRNNRKSHRSYRKSH